MDEVWKRQILDHYKNPRNFGKPAEVWHAAEEHNRTCGDHVTLFLDKSGHFSFTGEGCSLCLASASLMTELLGKDSEAGSRAAALRCLAEFKRVWEQGADAQGPSEWQALNGLRNYPVRSRCVKLSWQALEHILDHWQA
jgi:nitrogen fixation NifU-like protein